MRSQLATASRLLHTHEAAQGARRQLVAADLAAISEAQARVTAFEVQTRREVEAQPNPNTRTLPLTLSPSPSP